jgi:hypothetical protein
MKYSIDACEEFLRVKFSGRADDRPPSEVCAVVLQESAKRGRPRILIELDQKMPLSPGSQYALVSRLPEIGFTLAHRIALVHSTVEAWAANQFVNLVAQNRSMNVRNFRAIDEAEAWLRA